MKLLSFLALIFVSPLAEAVERIAILGDSITFDGRWACLVESALRGTEKYREAEIVNFGLGSETVSGLSEEGHAGGQFPRPVVQERLGRILEQFQPTLVLACYGMNCGIYQPKDEMRMSAYFLGMLKLKMAAEQADARLILVTAPLYQADDRKKDEHNYRKVLDTQAEWLLEQRKDEDWEVIDIRPDLKRGVDLGKGIEGFVYSADGIHPGEEGHRMIAEAVAKQLWALLKLPEHPKFEEGEKLAILRERHQLLKLAWLTKTGHLRPGVPEGLAMEEAEQKANELWAKFSLEK